MELIMEGPAFQELAYWVKNDRKIALKIIDLIEQTKREPFFGIGKHEPLKYDRKGCWSRRITQEHRLVYILLPMKPLSWYPAKDTTKHNKAPTAITDKKLLSLLSFIQS